MILLNLSSSTLVKNSHFGGTIGQDIRSGPSSYCEHLLGLHGPWDQEEGQKGREGRDAAECSGHYLRWANFSFSWIKGKKVEIFAVTALLPENRIPFRTSCLPVAKGLTGGGAARKPELGLEEKGQQGAESCTKWVKTSLSY